MSAKVIKLHHVRCTWFKVLEGKLPPGEAEKVDMSTEYPCGCCTRCGEWIASLNDIDDETREVCLAQIEQGKKLRAAASTLPPC